MHGLRTRASTRFTEVGSEPLPDMWESKTWTGVLKRVKRVVEMQNGRKGMGYEVTGVATERDGALERMPSLLTNQHAERKPKFWIRC